MGGPKFIRKFKKAKTHLKPPEPKKHRNVAIS